MTFPTSNVLDNFNRADEGPPPSSEWGNDPYGETWPGLEVVSNTCQGSSSTGYNANYWNVETFGPDSEGFVVIETVPDEGDRVGLAIRLQDPGDPTDYHLEIIRQSGDDAWRVYRTDSGGNYTQLGATFNLDISNGDAVGLEAVGDVLTVYHKPSAGSWTELFSRTDSTYTGPGYLALITYGDSANLNDFGGGSLSETSDPDHLPQSWKNSAENVLVRLSEDGRLLIGDEILMATDDALIEAHRDVTEVNKPRRGLHVLGEISGALDSIVSWIVQELILKGTDGIAALHSALRVRLANENTGTMDSGAALHGADIEVINNGGGNGNNVPDLTGLRVAVTNQANGYADMAHGVKVEMADAGSLDRLYALHADAGLVHVSGAFELPVLSSDPAETPPADDVLLYVKLDGGVPRWYSKDDNDTVQAL